MKTILTMLAMALSVAGAALAQTSATTPVSTTNATASSTTSGKAGSRLVAEFTSFAGSAANASALINGLRSASAITLTTPAATPASGTASKGMDGTTTDGGVSFSSPTRPMGYGNIRIALTLAQAELAKQGITQPTPQQLQTALMGSPAATGTTGASAPTTGLLQLRASGMGWGKIAHSLGVSPGMSSHASATTTGTTSYGHGGHAAKIAVTYSPYAGYSRSSGIVTASGASVSTASFGSGLGSGHGAMTGISTAQGSASRQGNAVGHAKGK